MADASAGEVDVKNDAAELARVLRDVDQVHSKTGYRPTFDEIAERVMETPWGQRVRAREAERDGLVARVKN